MSGFATLLVFPTELVCGIVGEWLCLEDVVHLDSACCHLEEHSIQISLPVSTVHHSFPVSLF